MEEQRYIFHYSEKFDLNIAMYKKALAAVNNDIDQAASIVQAEEIKN